MFATGRSLLGVVLWLPGCHSLAEPPLDPEAPIQTDRQTYEAQVRSGPATGGTDQTEWAEWVELTLVAELTNGYHEPAVVMRCGHDPPRWSLQRRSDGGWEEGGMGAGICHDILILPHVVLMPGETRVDTLRVRGHFAEDAFPRVDRDVVEGIYRITYDLREEGEPGCEECVGPPLPMELRVSNRFRILKVQ